MNKKYLIVLAVVIVIGIIGATMFFGGSSVDRNPNELVTAVGAHGGEPETGFDPIQGWASETEPLVQSTLLKRTHNMSLKNDLAESYSVDDDLKKYTVNIKNGVKFHDNTTLTANDVAFTYNKAKESGAAADLSSMVNATAINDTTVEFTLNDSDSTFINKLCSIGIVPEDSYENGTYGENPVGSGPYKFVQWDKGQQVILEINNDYYGDKPEFKKLTILFLENDAAFAAAKNGEVDIAEVPLSYANENVTNMSSVILDSVDARGISLPFLNDTGNTTEDGIPIGNNVTADENIRKALNYGIDRQTLIDGALNGHGSKSFDGIGPVLPWSNNDSAIEDGDSEKAKQFLKEGGWEDSDNDGIVEKNGTKASFKILYDSEDTTRQAIAISVSEQAKELGIEVIPEGKSWDEIDNGKLSNGVVWGYGSLDPSSLYHQYYGGLAGQDYDNPSCYNNSAVNQHMAQAFKTDINASYADWSQVSWDGSTGISPKGDAPWLWTSFVDYPYFVDNTLDISENTTTVQPHGGDIFGNIYDWKRVES
ncbi:MAG: ABC transporter substrate-binding protein [Methanobacteriaceae archaeon]|jgi:peptide/nickel transport system substrate-binding protein|nr:ABC transporter substrate-binding protein [Methanobacteriaceae archaeon]